MRDSRCPGQKATGCRKWTALAACVLALASACRDPLDDPDGGSDASHDTGPTGPRDGVSVMTWNLQEFPLAAGTISAVDEVLTELEPDLIAVQEIMDRDAFETLDEVLPEYDGILADDRGAFMVVGLLYRRATVNIGQVRTLFADDGWAFPRPPLAVWLTVDDGGGSASFNFVLVVVHLKAHQDAESEGRRRLACERLQEWIAGEVTDGTEEDFVVVGDWNDQLDDPRGSNVFRDFLDHPDRYTFLTMGPVEAGAYTYLPFESFIDHMLITNGALDEYGGGITRVLALEHSRPDYRDVLSDHRPVIATFELP